MNSTFAIPRFSSDIKTRQGISWPVSTVLTAATLTSAPSGSTNPVPKSSCVGCQHGLFSFRALEHKGKLTANTTHQIWQINRSHFPGPNRREGSPSDPLPKAERPIQTLPLGKHRLDLSLLLPGLAAASAVPRQTYENAMEFNLLLLKPWTLLFEPGVHPHQNGSVGSQRNARLPPTH